MFGQIGFSDSDLYEIKTNDLRVDPGLEFKTRMFGIGFRSAGSGARDRMWAFGYQRVESDEQGADSSDIYNFSDVKDNKSRYGEQGIAYTVSNDSRIYSIGGTHIWFVNSLLGMGLTWDLGWGQYDSPPGISDIRYRVASIGAVIMFRSDF